MGEYVKIWVGLQFVGEISPLRFASVEMTKGSCTPSTPSGRSGQALRLTQDKFGRDDPPTHEATEGRPTKNGHDKRG